MSSQLPQVPLLSSSASLKEVNEAVLFILEYLIRLQREAERSDDTVQQSADEANTGLDAKVDLAGDTMTGALVLPGNATLALHATPLQQVQALDAAGLANYACVVDEKTSGTAGGTLTAGSYLLRDLNTVRHDDIGITVGSNQITLPAGTYRVRASAPAWSCDQHKARLWDDTAGAVLLVGTSEFIQDNTSSVTRSQVVGEFTLAVESAIQLEHRGTSTKTTDGFGLASSFGDTEVYSIVELWKVA